MDSVWRTDGWTNRQLSYYNINYFVSNNAYVYLITIWIIRHINWDIYIYIYSNLPINCLYALYKINYNNGLYYCTGDISQDCRSWTQTKVWEVPGGTAGRHNGVAAIADCCWWSGRHRGAGSPSGGRAGWCLAQLRHKVDNQHNYICNNNEGTVLFRFTFSIWFRNTVIIFINCLKYKLND